MNTTITEEWGTGLKSKKAGKLVLLLSGDDGMVQTALLTPMLASIMMEFPGKDPLLYNQMVSITALMMCLTMFLSNYLAKRFNKKWLIIFGTFCFALAGLLCSLAPSLEYLMVMRAFLGFGAGMALPLVPSAIAQLFVDREKDQMLGWLNATGSILSFVLSTVAGFIAVVQWRAAFWLYLIFVPIIITQFLCLPNFKPEGIKHKEDNKVKHIPLGWRSWMVALNMLVVMALITLVMYKMSPIIEFNNLGDSSATGVSISVMTISSFCAALFFGNYFSKLKRFSPVLSLFVGGLSFALLGFAANLPMIYASSVFCGLALGSLNPFFMSSMSEVAPIEKMTFAMTLICVCQIGSQVVTPYYIAVLSVLGIVDDQATCLVTAGLLVLIGLIFLAFALFGRKSGSPEVKKA